MKLGIVIFSIILITINSANAIPSDEWIKTYDFWNYGCGGTCYHDIFSIQQTSDGGYIAAGSYGDDDSIAELASYVSLMFKIDSKGNVQWKKTGGGSASHNSVQLATDGGYIFVGKKLIDIVPDYTITEYDQNIILTKTDSLGNKQWEKTFGKTGICTGWPCKYYHDNAYSVIVNNGYIIVGETESYGAGGSDGWLIKTDNNGNKLWDKTFGGTGKDFIKSIDKTLDGRYVLAGSTSNNMWLIKTDGSGNKLWAKTYGAGIAESVIQKNGNYIFAGSSSGNAKVIKTDENGNILWSKTYGTGSIKSVQSSDGGYILAAKIGGIGTVIKIDENGNVLWKKTYGSVYANFARQTKDKGYIIAGSIPVGSDTNAWIAKLSNENINLLKNPGFETLSGTLPAYWTKYQTGTKAIFTYPETGRVGGKSVSIKYTARETGKAALWWQQGIVVSPSKQYKLSGYMKLEGVTGSGATPRPGGASLRVNWYRSDGGLIKVDWIGKVGTIGWTKYEKIFTAPSNAVKATVGGDLFDSAGKVWFDDLSFIKMS